MSVVGGDWMGLWLGGSVAEVTVTPPTPIPSPIPADDPDFVDHVEAGISRLVLQFRKRST